MLTEVRVVEGVSSWIRPTVYMWVCLELFVPECRNRVVCCLLHDSATTAVFTLRRFHLQRHPRRFCECLVDAPVAHC